MIAVIGEMTPEVLGVTDTSNRELDARLLRKEVPCLSKVVVYDPLLGVKSLTWSFWRRLFINDVDNCMSSRYYLHLLNQH